MKACAQKVKNGLAPHLKSVIGCWVSGMHDPYRPAMSAAQESFASAFSAARQEEVFMFTFKAYLRVSLFNGEDRDNFHWCVLVVVCMHTRGVDGRMCTRICVSICMDVFARMSPLTIWT